MYQNVLAYPLPSNSALFPSTKKPSPLRVDATSPELKKNYCLDNTKLKHLLLLLHHHNLITVLPIPNNMNDLAFNKLPTNMVHTFTCRNTPKYMFTINCS